MCRRGGVLAALVVLGLGLGVVASCGGGTVSTATLHPSRTVTYCVDGGVPLAMDLYLAPRAKAKGGARVTSPLVLYVHGGAWILGSSRSDPFLIALVPVLEAAGISVASIDYRLAPAARFPAQIEDVTCALRFLRATGPLDGLAGSDVVAMGESAGGQLVSLLGVAGTDAAWDNGQWGSESARPSAVVDLFGPTDLTAGGWIPAMATAIQETFGAQPPATGGALAEASPVTWVAPGDPPFLVLQGLADTIVPPSQSTELVERLRAAHDPVSYVMVTGGGHGLTEAGERPDEIQLVHDVAQFVERQLARAR